MAYDYVNTDDSSDIVVFPAGSWQAREQGQFREGIYSKPVWLRENGVDCGQLWEDVK